MTNLLLNRYSIAIQPISDRYSPHFRTVSSSGKQGPKPIPVERNCNRSLFFNIPRSRGGCSRSRGGCSRGLGGSSRGRSGCSRSNSRSSRGRCRNPRGRSRCTRSGCGCTGGRGRNSFRGCGTPRRGRYCKKTGADALLPVSTPCLPNIEKKQARANAARAAGRCRDETYNRSIRDYECDL